MIKKIDKENEYFEREVETAELYCQKKTAELFFFLNKEIVDWEVTINRSHANRNDIKMKYDQKTK